VHSGVGGAGALRYVSDDGQRAYFVTRGIVGDPGAAWNQMPEGGTTAPSGGPTSGDRNLYLFDATKSGDDRWRFIAALPTSGHSANPCASLIGQSGMTQYFELANVVGGLIVRYRRLDNNCVRGVEDGRAIAFETAAPLTTDDTDEASDIYYYDAVADELLRVTAPPDNDASYVCAGDSERCNGDFGFQPQILGSNDRIGLHGAQRANLAVNDEGTATLADDTVSVFFETRLPLAPEDTNGSRMDVYEWQAGAVSLLSPGDSADHDAYFSGNSEDGDDVFFQTAQRLDPREIDEDYDVYDARVGGGFPYSPPPSSCDALADGCAGPGAGPLTGSRGTEDPDGDGDADAPRRASLLLGSISKKARVRAARSGVVMLPVRVSRAGKVTAVARAAIGGKRRTVGAGARRISRAGRFVLRVRLNPAARQRLRQGRALAIDVSVRMPGALTRDKSIRLKRVGR
jgi:hypothetical protein